MHWLLFTLWLNAQTGDVGHVDPPQEVDIKTCLETRPPELPKDGLVAFHICRQVDAAGNPVPEKKASADEDAPKVNT